MHEAGYFVTRNDRRWNVVVLSEIAVNELDVGATHSTRLDLDEHLIWRNVRNRHVLENEGFVVLPDASCLHTCLLRRVCMWWSNAWSCQPWPSAVAAEHTDVLWLTPLRPLPAAYKRSIIFSATPLAEAGFCPVTRFPSATLNGCQGVVLWKIAPCFVSAVSNSNGTSAFA